MREAEITPATLMQLVPQAMVTYLGCAPKFEASCRAGIWTTLCGEPVADLNYVIATSDAPEAIEALDDVVADLDARGLPFVCMLGPGLEHGLKPACERAGLAYAVDWPLMVCAAGGGAPHARDDVEIAAVRSERDVASMADVLAAAFGMPRDAVRRTLPLRTAEIPGIEFYVARIGDSIASTVTVTRHGAVAGVWAMGTPPDMQGRGVGKVLLSQVMDRYRRAGVEAFFLGATPAGRPLYEKLGYREVARAQVWVRGESGQV